MRLSQYYMPTLREVPADAEMASHQLMLRAAMIRKAASGVYTYLPMGLKLVQKVEKVVREEMNRAGSLEILMSAIQPKEIWEESGRWSLFGPEMFKLKDRNEREFCLGPTAEEYFTSLIKGEVKSYKQLPLNLYQIQTKYRDEKRPRFGVNRAREFSMKDAYSFDSSEENMVDSYMNMYRAYEKIFDRLCLDYRVCQGDSGAMGGNGSHEFIALSESGEGVIVYTEDGSYAATDEKAAVFYTCPKREEPVSMTKVHTPGKKTIEEVSGFLKIEMAKCAKAIDYIVEGKPVFVFIPGDREINETKLVSYLGVPEHEVQMMDDITIESMGSAPGFTGPLDLHEDARIIVDESLTKIDNLVVGANEEDYHLTGVNYGRDFKGEIVKDLLMVQEGDKSEEGKELLFARGIEVGNIFQLGKKYSESLHATFLDENGKEQFFWMGSYGVGITRTVSAIVEQYHDDRGIVWPIAVAPFEAIVTVVNSKKEDQMKLGEEIYESLINSGIDVVLDDRKERAGVKFNDRDLIGIPLRISVGKVASDRIVEYSTRTEGVNQDISVEEAISRVVQIVESERK